MTTGPAIRRVVYLFAHADDEFACSIPIRTHTRRGTEVHCVYTTDGGYGGQSATRRQNESLKVLDLLGVDEANVHFLGARHGFPDGALHTRLEEAAKALAECLEALGPVDVIHLPAWEGGHQDHDATHLIGVDLALRLGVPEIRQFPLYQGQGLRGPLFRVMRPLPENGPVRVSTTTLGERLLAISLGFRYASQWKTWMGLLPFFAWHLLTRGTFPCQGIDPLRLRQSPHSGLPLYERRGFLSLSEFQDAAVAFLAKREL